MSTTIRVSEQTRDRFAQLSTQTGKSMTELVDQAADALERHVFFEQLNAGYRTLRADDTAWAEVEREREVENLALRDRSH